MIAAGIDGNNKIVIYAWGLAESETKVAWTFFLKHLLRAIPEVNSFETTIMSDRCKGLRSSSERLVPLCNRAFCSEHIAENIRTGYGGAPSVGLFWELAKARLASKFADVMAKIERTRPRLAEYLQQESIDPAIYARSSFPGMRYGYLTSNVVESVNGLFVKARAFPALQMLDHIWGYEMNKRFGRLVEIERQVTAHRQDPNAPHQPHSGPTGLGFTPWATTKLGISLEFGRRMASAVRMSTRTIGSVLDGTDRERYRVNLAERTCTCRRYQDTGIPCGHAVAVIQRLRQEAADHMPEYTHAETYIATYQSAVAGMPPIDLGDVLAIHKTGLTSASLDANLQPVQRGPDNPLRASNRLPVVNPPLTRRGPGRPEKLRYRRGEARRRAAAAAAAPRARPRCTSCQMRGHYASRCRNPHE